MLYFAKAMHLFYTPDINNNKSYTLNESESKHAIHVLRLNENDTIKLIDGRGNYYEAIIVHKNPKKCEVKILNTSKLELTKPYLHIAIAPTKNNDRIEWFIEKCTEIGQSLKATLPKVNDLKSFKDLVNKPFEGKKYIAHCYNDNQKHFRSIYQKGENSLILIGPEGDFSKEEVKLAIEIGFEPITFGTSRLRTETAGIVACTTFNIINE
jgi:16S rRNA (uracil1498-N3)-methyltransferase